MKTALTPSARRHNSLAGRVEAGPERPAEGQHFYQRIYFHKLGADPAGDTYVAGRDFPKVAEIALDNRQDSRVIVAAVANGDGGEFAHYLIGPSHSVTQVTRFEDKITAVVAGPDDNLYPVSRQDAPHGKLLRLPVSDPVLAHATEIVPRDEPVLQGGGEFGGTPVVVTQRGLYVRELVGGPSQVARFDHDGRRRVIAPGTLTFVVFRRDLVANAPEKVPLRIAARVARSMNFDSAGKAVMTTPATETWIIRDQGYNLRVSPLREYEMVMLRSEDPEFSFPSGRYELMLGGQAYDFVVAGEVTDPAHCVEGVATVRGPEFYECKPVL